MISGSNDRIGADVCVCVSGCVSGCVGVSVGISGGRIIELLFSILPTPLPLPLPLPPSILHNSEFNSELICPFIIPFNCAFASRVFISEFSSVFTIFIAGLSIECKKAASIGERHIAHILKSYTSLLRSLTFDGPDPRADRP